MELRSLAEQKQVFISNINTIKKKTEEKKRERKHSSIILSNHTSFEQTERGVGKINRCVFFSCLSTNRNGIKQVLLSFDCNV